MRTIAIGDIHGCTRAFDGLLAQIDLQPDDRLITLGDYVDRGPDSKGIIDRLLALRAKHQVICVRGNHDQMMVDARDGRLTLGNWLMMGGRETLASYPPNGTFDDVPPAHWKFLEKDLLDWCETKTHFFVHANVYPDMRLSEQPLYVLHYEKFNDPPPHCSNKIMICGHTAQKTGLPRNLGHAICIDTWVYGEGWLTGLELRSGRVWQANQRGEQRTSHIDDHAMKSG